MRRRFVYTRYTEAPVNNRLGYQDSFDRAKKSQSLLGSPRPDVTERPRHDDVQPGPSFFKAELIKTDLSELTLPGLFIGRSDLRGVNLSASDLRLSTLCWNEFILCDFRGATLLKSDLRASNFDRCTFKDAVLDGCDLRHATFEACDFSGASMKGALLTNGQRKKLPLTQDQVDVIDWVQLGGAFPDGA